MLCQLIDPEIILRTLEELEKENERYKGFAFSTRQCFFADALMPIYENISAVGNKLAFELFTPLKNSIRRADEFSSKLPVTDLYGAPLRGTDSNLHWYKVTLSFGIGKSYVDADNALLLAKKRKAEITYPIHDLLE